MIYMGSRERQVLLSKLGMWGSWVSIEGERGGRENIREKYIAQ